MVKAKDYTGVKVGRLTAVRKTENMSGHGYVWEFMCDCGGTHFAKICHVVGGKTTRCKQCRPKASPSRKKRVVRKGHTPKTGEYSSWDCMIQRCHNQNNPNYANYGGRGLVVDEIFRKSFDVFLEHIGPQPDSETKWSVGRLDNDKGYVAGNIRWESPAQQSMNKRKRKTNTSGITGVCWTRDKLGRKKNALSQCVGLDGEKITKAYSISKYGEELAFELACKHRRETISYLNSIGAEYSEKHGL